MNKTYLVLLIILILIAGGSAYGYWQINKPAINEDILVEEKLGKTLEQDKLPDSISLPQKTVAEEPRYQYYSMDKFTTLSLKKRILFFYDESNKDSVSSDTDFLNNISQIPSEVIIFKVNSKSYSDLKKKYEITSDNSLVLIDSDGKILNKWVSSGVASLGENLK